MTCIYRILRCPYAKKPFDGEGAYRFGGRWSSPGTRVVYAAEHLSLAMLEYFVHLDAEDLPKDLVLVTVHVPESVRRLDVDAKELPVNWRETPGPPELVRIGDEFIQNRDTAILTVRSALAPAESNWLINPLHPSFPKLRILPVEPFRYDPRFFR
ncbi:MAG: RES family NAD+ phosphorylase [Acidobacteriota bacterium]|nr:RES family NAD+ phosphorylase [Acidobacteriota bacterium]